MSAQLELTPAAAPAEDPILTALRAAAKERPGHKLIHVTDPAMGYTFVLSIAPQSPWHELLPDWQTVVIDRALPAHQQPRATVQAH